MTDPLRPQPPPPRSGTTFAAAPPTAPKAQGDAAAPAVPPRRRYSASDPQPTRPAQRRASDVLAGAPTTAAAAANAAAEMGCEPSLGAGIYFELCDRVGADLAKESGPKLLVSKPVRANKQIATQLGVTAYSLLTTSSLDCSLTLLGTAGISVVLELLRHHQHVAHLDLSGNSVETRTVLHVVDVAREHQSLSRITLTGNALATPSARALWRLACDCPRVEWIDLGNTNLSPEWNQRIERQLEKNRQFNSLGFIHDPVPRSPSEWTTRFFFVWATPDMADLATVLVEEVFPVLNEFFALYRLHLVPLVHVRPDEDPQRMASHVRLCRDPFLDNLPWVISLMGAEMPVAWEFFLKEHILPLERAEPPPLKSKLGEIRAPVRRVLFTSLAYYGNLDVTDTVDNPRRDEIHDLMRSHAATCNFDMDRGRVPWVLRAQTDLLTALSVPYAPREMAPPTCGRSAVADHATQYEATIELMASRLRNPTIPVDAYAREVNEVVSYCSREMVGEYAFPMILYGVAGSGAAATMGYVYDELVRVSDEAAAQLQEAQTIGYADESRQAALVTVAETRVVPYTVAEDPSLIRFLLFVMAVFGAGDGLPTGHNGDLEALQLMARDAITAYPADAPRIVLLVVGADSLDDAWRPHTLEALWLPLSFHSNVRVVTSVVTHSSLLRLVRKREQQPHDVRLTPQPRHVYIQTLRKQLAQRQINIVGIGEAQEEARWHEEDLRGVRTEPVTVCGAIFAKEDSDTALYSMLLSALLEIDDVFFLETEHDVFHYFQATVPHTCAEIVTRLMTHLEHRYGSGILRDIALTLCSTHVTLPELGHFVEHLFGRPQFDTFPIVVYMQHLSLVRVSASGAVIPVHRIVRNALVKFFTSHDTPEPLNPYRATIAVHHLQRVRTRGHGFRRSFQLLRDLLLHAGQVRTLASLLLDVLLLDSLVQGDVSARAAIFDAMWCAIHHLRYLRSVVSLDGFAARQFHHDALRGRLEHALYYFATCRGNPWQNSLSMPRDSPLFQATAQITTVPYPSAKLLNRAYAEHISIHQRALSSSLCHCSMFGSFAAVAAPCGDCFVLDMRTGEVIARRTDAFVGFHDRVLLGATLCDKSNVVLIGASQLVLWNIDTDKTLEYPGLTCSLHASATRGPVAVVVNIQTQQVSVMDLQKGTTLSEPPHLPHTTHIAEAHFCGESVLIVTGPYEAALFRPEDSTKRTSRSGQTVLLPIDGARWITSAHASTDGRQIAICAGTVVTLFNNDGDVANQLDHGMTPVLDATFHPNGAQLCSCTQDGHLFLWQTLTGHRHKVLQTMAGAAQFAQFVPDGTKLIARCGTMLRMWDGTTFEDMGGVTAHDGPVRFLVTSTDTMVTVGGLGVAKIWDLGKAFPNVRRMQQASEPSTDLVSSGFVSHSPVSQVVISPGHHTLAVRTEDGKVTLWALHLDGERSAPLRQVLTHSTVSTLAFRHDNSLLYVVAPGELHILPAIRTRNKHLARNISGATSGELESDSGADDSDENAAAAHLSEHRLSSSGVAGALIDGASNVFGYEENETVLKMPLDVDPAATWVLKCGIENDLDLAVCVANYDRASRIVVFNVGAKHKAMHTQFSAYPSSVAAAELADKAVVVGGSDGHVRVWSLRTHAERCSYPHGTPITTLGRISGGRLLLGDESGRLIALTLTGNTFQNVWSLPAPLSGAPRALAPMSRTVIAVAVEGNDSVMLIDLRTQRVVNQALGSAPAGPLITVAATPPSNDAQERYLVFGSCRGYVDLFDVYGLGVEDDSPALGSDAGLVSRPATRQ